MSRVVCCVLLGVKFQISHGCNLKKNLCGAKRCNCIANWEEHLEKGLFYTYFIAAIIVVKFKCAK